MKKMDSKDLKKVEGGATKITYSNLSSKNYFCSTQGIPLPKKKSTSKKTKMTKKQMIANKK